VIRVKVCGLTTRDDALRAAELGADALGFVFAPRSRRRADPDTVARAVEELPPFVTTVGVFQDQPAHRVREIARGCRLGLLQLHGGEDLEYARSLGWPVLKAVGLERREDLRRLEAFPGLGVFLLDAAAGGTSGGTGRSFHWEWAREAKRFGRIVLAGGLGPHNVSQAVRLARPWAVDAASGTETSPGRKDIEKMRLFIRRAKEAGRGLARRSRSHEGAGWEDPHLC
jgi:phosphoribosylanthranilate isomerase